MAKLVATYAAGMFAVFTEDRTGMRQRALIDIGDNTPTPNEMADLAGLLSDQWGWGNQIERSPKPVKAIAPKRKREFQPRDNSDPKPAERETLIIEWLAEHSGQFTAKEIIAGLGFETTEQRVGRWHHAFVELMKAKRVAMEIRQIKTPGKGGVVRKYIYSTIE